MASFLCRELLDMGSKQIVVKLRVENSLNGALKVYFWSDFAPKTGKFLKTLPKFLFFGSKILKKIVFNRQ